MMSCTTQRTFVVVVVVGYYDELHNTTHLRSSSRSRHYDELHTTHLRSSSRSRLTMMSCTTQRTFVVVVVVGLL